VSPLDRTDANATADEPTQTCTAFPLPGGIPDEIWWNHADHRKPYEGDHELQWTPIKEAAFPEWAMNTKE
jgi:hypothetical protein